MNLIKSIMKYSLLGGVFIVSLTACTDEITNSSENPSKQPISGDGVILSLNLAQPGAQMTRTATGSTTNENGRPYENEVSQVLIIFGDENDKVLSFVYANELEAGSDGNYAANDPYFENEGSGDNSGEGATTIHPVQNLYTAYAELSVSDAEKIKGKTVNVFVVCNPPSDLTIGEDIQQVITTATIADTYALGSKNIDRDGLSRQNYQFLMTNADYDSPQIYSTNPYQVTIGADLTTGGYNKKENAYPVGGTGFSIPVQRAVARFDVDDSNPKFYFTEDGSPTTQSDKAQVTITLEYFGIINQSKSLNLFKETGYLEETEKDRGNVDPSNKTGWDFFYPEVSSFTDGIVFDPNYAEKKALAQASSPTYSTTTNTYFHNYIFETNIFTKKSNFDRTVVGKNLTGDVFSYFNTEDKSNFNKDLIWDANKKYKIRRYCLPNTIHEIDQQRNGNTTAPVFITNIKFAEGCGEGSLDESSNRGFDEDETVMRHECPIYAYENVFYGVNRFLQLTAANPGDAKAEAMKVKFNEAVAERYATIALDMNEDKTTFKGLTIQRIQDEIKDYMVKENPEQEWTDVRGGYDYGSYDFSKAGDKKDLYELYNDFLWFSAQNLTEGEEDETGEEIEYRHRFYRVLPSPGLAQSLVNKGFSIYLSTDPDGDNNYEYQCYYLYWNRHNDNNNNGKMGAMEFSVVRNNIYKLKVSSISRIGHPIPRPDKPDYPVDPDPVIPNTPDETTKSYFQVDLRVVDWNVIKDDDIILGH